MKYKHIPYHHTPVYNVEKSYEYNLQNGPFFFGPKIPRVKNTTEWKTILGHKVASTIGIPAGPLLNSAWCALALDLGYDIVTYKTIRSTAHPAHPLPNIVHVHANTSIQQPFATQQAYEETQQDIIGITNSFGMPSMDNEYIKKDIEKTLGLLKKGQLLIVSITGTNRKDMSFVEDLVHTADIAINAGAKILEINCSCPNVVTGEGSIYQDPKLVHTLISSIQKSYPQIQILIKVGHYTNLELMKQVFDSASEAGAKGICGINTIPMQVKDKYGNPALGKNREISGICGSPIHKAAIHWTKIARSIIDKEGYPLTILSTGGITKYTQFQDMYMAGADVAMTGTGFMWDPYLAMRYHLHNIN